MGQMKRIAVITGASSGMGKRFTETLQEGGVFDEVWVIARREERLKELSCPYPVRPLALDLTDRASFDAYEMLLKSEDVQVGLLINCSGFGKFSATMDVSLAENLNMVDLNCQALMAMCQITIPFMPRGGKIVNIASVAAIQPIPYINVYAATKAFVLHFGRALNREIKKLGLSCMTVCPFWTQTEFFGRAIKDDENAVVKKYIVMYTPEQIVSRAWRDLKKGKDMSMYGFVARFQSLLAKLAPHSFVMSYWMNQQKLN